MKRLLIIILCLFSIFSLQAGGANLKILAKPGYLIPCNTENQVCSCIRMALVCPNVYDNNTPCDFLLKLDFGEYHYFSNDSLVTKTIIVHDYNVEIYGKYSDDFHILDFEIFK